MIFEAERSKLKLRLLLLFPLLLIGLAICLAFNAESIRPLTSSLTLQTRTVTTSLMCLGLLGGAYYFYKFWSFHNGLPYPWLRVDERGIVWQEWSTRPIAWDNIEKVIVSEPSRAPFLKVYLRDPAASPALHEPAARRARSNRSALKHDFLIFLPVSSARANELETVIRWFLEERHDRLGTFE